MNLTKIEETQKKIYCSIGIRIYSLDNNPCGEFKIPNEADDAICKVTGKDCGIYSFCNYS